MPLFIRQRAPADLPTVRGKNLPDTGPVPLFLLPNRYLIGVKCSPELLFLLLLLIFQK